MIYYFVSGGKDSTAMVLDAFDKGEKITLVYGDTRLNMKSSEKTLRRLAEYTQYPLITVRYEGEKKPITILKEAFKQIPKALEFMKETGKYRRNMFHCCDILKHRPLIDFSLEQPKDSIFALGIKGGDHAIHRIYRMRQLREQNIFYRRHKSNGLLYYYPLRDWTEEDVSDKLREHGFQDTKSSGCSICPIFCMFETWKDKDPDTWRRSIRFADSLGIKHPASGQQFFRNCGEIMRTESPATSTGRRTPRR